MALFKGRDVKLPLLTQIAQLWLYPEEDLYPDEGRERAAGEGDDERPDPMEGGELDRFICQYFNAVEPSYDLEEECWTRTAEAGSREVNKGLPATEQLWALAKDLEALIAVMEAVAAGLTPDIDNVATANEFVNGWWPRQQVFLMPVESSGGSDIGDEEKLVVSVTPTLAGPDQDYGTGYSLLELLATLIARDFVEVLRHPETLNICASCGNVFVVTRRQQLYCSRRCAARVGERRRRESAKGAARGEKGVSPASLERVPAVI